VGVSAVADTLTLPWFAYRERKADSSPEAETFLDLTPQYSAGAVAFPWPRQDPFDPSSGNAEDH
jgi:hypothetical protein